jgi:hypothetical protein
MPARGSVSTNWKSAATRGTVIRSAPRLSKSSVCSLIGSKSAQGQKRGHCEVIIVGALAQILETIEIAGDDFVNRQAPG